MKIWLKYAFTVGWWYSHDCVTGSLIKSVLKVRELCWMKWSKFSCVLYIGYCGSLCTSSYNTNLEILWTHGWPLECLVQPLEFLLWDQWWVVALAWQQPHTCTHLLSSQMQCSIKKYYTYSGTHAHTHTHTHTHTRIMGNQRKKLVVKKVANLYGK